MSRRREQIKDNNIRYLSQNSIYKNLYPYLFEAGHILPSLKLEDSDQIKIDSDSDISEADLILTKKKKFIQAIKFNSTKSLQLIFQLKILKKQHPVYRCARKGLAERNYEKAEYCCNEFLKTFPRDYSIRCILAYIYRCLNDYNQAHLHLDDAISLRPKNPIAYFIQGEILFREKMYDAAVDALNRSITYEFKLNNLNLILGNILFYQEYTLNADVMEQAEDVIKQKFNSALEKYKIVLQNDPNNYLCLRNCAYIYENQKNFLRALRILKKLLKINENDSLILCYYGEILMKLGRYIEAESYFTNANNLDPENIHILIKRATNYIVLQEYDKALLDLDKALQLDTLNALAYYNKGLTYYLLGQITDAIILFKQCIELDSNDDLAKAQIYYLEYLLVKNSFKDLSNIIEKINQISNIKNSKLLLIIRCKIYIELEKYEEALKDLNSLFELYNGDISFLYLLKRHSDFWTYLCKSNDHIFKDLGIFDSFNVYMYRSM